MWWYHRSSSPTGPLPKKCKFAVTSVLLRKLIHCHTRHNLIFGKFSNFRIFEFSSGKKQMREKGQKDHRYNRTTSIQVTSVVTCDQILTHVMSCHVVCFLRAPTETTKAGRCPATIMGGLCSTQCTTDRDCGTQNNYKCCAHRYQCAMLFFLPIYQATIVSRGSHKYLTISIFNCRRLQIFIHFITFIMVLRWF